MQPAADNVDHRQRQQRLDAARWRQSGTPASAASARAQASETARIAFAPRRDLSARAVERRGACRSTAPRSTSAPVTASAISPFTAATAPQDAAAAEARRIAVPASTASCRPVEAPEGTLATTTLPSASSSSASTVGRPRESRISRPRTAVMCSRAERLLVREPAAQQLVREPPHLSRSGPVRYSAGDLPSTRASSRQPSSAVTWASGGMAP